MARDDLLDRESLCERVEPTTAGGRTVPEDDEVRHDRARHGRLPSDLTPELGQSGFDRFGRRGTPRPCDYSARHCRPADSMSRSASSGPHDPAAYAGIASAFCALQRSRIGITHRHPASTASRRMNSVESPTITSSSSRSYASGDVPPKVLP